MIYLKEYLITAFPIVLSCVLIRSLSVSKTDLLPETDSDGGEDCDYIHVDGSGNSSIERATILSFDTMNRMKSFMVKTARREKKDVRSNSLVSESSLMEKDSLVKIGFKLNYNTLTR